MIIDKFLSDNNLKKYLNTNLEKYKKVGDTRSKKFYHETKVDLTQEYLSLGNRTSNNIFLTLEVIEKGYKGFFIEVWYSQGLISFYDKYCLTKGYENQNNNYVYKAMKRIYQIIDNRQIFLEYLTRKTVSFKKEESN